MARTPSRLDSLSGRDRKLLAFLVLFFSLVGTSILWFNLRGSLEDKASRVRSAKDNLEIIVVMEEMYLEAAATILASEERLKTSGGERLDAFVEKIAVQTDVRDALHSVDARGTEKVGNLSQTRYELQLRKLPLTNALDFLYDLETSGYPVSVKRATFKSVFVSGSRLVNVNADVVTLSIEEGG